MYIEPNTDIYILHNVPLDTTYDHTIWFANATDQANYFINLRKYTLSDYTYQRVKRGYMRVGINANNLYDCNYLMFRNTNFGSKWFYAYITSVEYVNNDVSEIVFEIDDMQTWFFDYSLDECFVEREHSATDVIGDNIVPESVELGEYVKNHSLGATYGHEYGYTKFFPFYEQPWVIIQVVQVNGAAVQGRITDNIYSGCFYEAVRCVYPADVDYINNYLAQFISDPDAIINMYMVPVSYIYPGDITQLPGYSTQTAFTYPIGSTGYVNDTQKGITYKTGATADDTTRTYPIPDVFGRMTGVETLDGYLPHNKKLYTYPYNFLNFDDSNGNDLSLRYEFFTNGVPKFIIHTTYVSPAKAILMPLGYGGNGDNYADYSNQLVLEKYPECSWNADFYKVWLSQNFGSSLIKAGGNLLGGMFLSPQVGLKNAIESVSNSVAEGYHATKIADFAKGNFDNSNVLFSNNQYSIRVGRMSVKASYAKIIDQYFDKFGYKTNLLKVPNTHARARWCFTKTIACTISGSIPADSAKHICEIYNNGITFWRNGQTVGDYSNAVTNTPNGEVGD